ncbi:MAG: hypothetical protein ACK4V2_07265 [Pseudomonadota bacterium]|jgi:hypothetical protein|nr:hypothetical protein [Alphaproteobacteria bacterium]
MKKTIFILLSLFQLYSAIVVEALPAETSSKESEQYWSTAFELAKNNWEKMPDWEDNFDVDGGSATIYHGKNWIRIVSNLTDSLDEDISQYQQPCDEIYLTKWQDKSFRYPLRLKWHSSREDFVNELIRAEFINEAIRSKFYKPTVEEIVAYQSSYKWQMSHSVIGMGEVIDHYRAHPKGHYFLRSR